MTTGRKELDMNFQAIKRKRRQRVKIIYASKIYASQGCTINCQQWLNLKGVIRELSFPLECKYFTNIVSVKMYECC